MDAKTPHAHGSIDRGFYTILAAQFFSALADNALLFAAIALLGDMAAPTWQTPVLQQFFVFSYIALAPFVGPFADAIPKGRVMFVSNVVKFAGCLAMLLGVYPLYDYGIVGIGAAMYSPAKYGILTEYLPPSKLVLANGWMEGLTVAAIILGAILGGVLLNPAVSAAAIQAAHIPGLETPSRFAVAIIVLLYVGAGIFNLYIPRVAIDHKLPKKTVSYILHDFWHCFRLLWRDPLGQVSLAVTTLFWGAGATLRLIILAWALAALNMPMNKATILTAWVALGIAVGSMIAAKWVQLDRSVKVLPVGIGMGVLTMAMVLVRQDFFGSGAIYVAIGLLVAIGAMAGYFVVPMNALLQHRGHLLMGAGHSIAVQNFNENLSILVMLGLYAAMEWAGLSVYWITVVFGLLVSSIMTLLWKRHRHDQDRGQM